MLLESQTITVPALAERDADINEYGELSLKLRQAFGLAACEAGNPDHDATNAETSAADTIANVLHWLTDEGGDVSRVLSRARCYFAEETA
jgi:hypothetical protein